jgi:hypothetical protein
MKNFGLLMIVGIIEGTYSTVFIASPIVLEWENAAARRRKRRELVKYGVHERPKQVTAEEPEVEEETDVDDAVALPGATPAPYPSVPTPDAEQPATEHGTAPAAPETTAPGPVPAAIARDQGSHRHQRRKRRHH